MSEEVKGILDMSLDKDEILDETMAPAKDTRWMGPDKIEEINIIQYTELYTGWFI